MALYIKTKLMLALQFFAKNKAAFYLLIGLVVLSAIIYASQHLLFLSYKNRQILGISLFSVSGFFLTLDQILKITIKDETYKKEGVSKKVAEFVDKFISKDKVKSSLRILLFVFPTVLIAIMIFQAVSTGEALPWSAIGGIILGILIMFNSYLYILTYTNRLFTKLGNRWQQFKDTSRNMLYSNIFLFLGSLILAYIAIYVRELIWTPTGPLDISQPLLSITWQFIQLLPLVIWAFFSIFIISPVFVLSFSYFIVLALVWLYFFFRRPTPRFVFWTLIFMFWIIGSILLLTNAIFA